MVLIDINIKQAYCFHILYMHYMTTDNKLRKYWPKLDISNGFWQPFCNRDAYIWHNQENSLYIRQIIKKYVRYVFFPILRMSNLKRCYNVAATLFGNIQRCSNVIWQHFPTFAQRCHSMLWQRSHNFSGIRFHNFHSLLWKRCYNL